MKNIEKNAKLLTLWLVYAYYAVFYAVGVGLVHLFLLLIKRLDNKKILLLVPVQWKG